MAPAPHGISGLDIEVRWGHSRRIVASQAAAAGVPNPGLIANASAAMPVTFQPSPNAAASSSRRTRRRPRSADGSPSASRSSSATRESGWAWASDPSASAASGAVSRRGRFCCIYPPYTGAPPYGRHIAAEAGEQLSQAGFPSAAVAQRWHIAAEALSGAPFIGVVSEFRQVRRGRDAARALRAKISSPPPGRSRHGSGRRSAARGAASRAGLRHEHVAGAEQIPGPVHAGDSVTRSDGRIRGDTYRAAVLRVGDSGADQVAGHPDWDSGGARERARIRVATALAGDFARKSGLAAGPGHAIAMSSPPGPAARL